MNQERRSQLTLSIEKQALKDLASTNEHTRVDAMLHFLRMKQSNPKDFSEKVFAIFPLKGAQRKRAVNDLLEELDEGR